MHISEQGLTLIKQYEGFSPTLYLCPAGKWTIGYGHAVLAHEQYAEPLSEDAAETLLKQDVGLAEQGVGRIVTIALNQNQFDALVSFAYNIGLEAFENSTLLRLLNRGNRARASAQFARWDHCGAKVLAGLAARRSAEAALFNKT